MQQATEGICSGRNEGRLDTEGFRSIVNQKISYGCEQVLLGDGARKELWRLLTWEQ
jgi:hypothetical protein